MAQSKGADHETANDALFNRPQLESQPVTGPSLKTLVHGGEWASFVRVENHKLYYMIREALTYQLFELDGEWPTAKLADKKGHIVALLQLRPDPARMTGTMQRQDVKSMLRTDMIRLAECCGHLTADVLDLICATARSQANPISPNEYSTDAFLMARGLRQHLGGESVRTGKRYRGGYSKEQRSKVSTQISILAHLFLKKGSADVHLVDRDGKRNREHIEIVERPLLLFHEIRQEIGARKNSGFQAWRIAPSEHFAKILMGGTIGILPLQALRYDPENEYMPKGLARYLPYRWRINHKRGVKSVGQYMPQGLRVDLLLERIHERVCMHHPGRTADRLDKALDRLVEDGVCKSWRYNLTADDNELYAQRRRGWIEVWLSARLFIEPSDEFVQELGEMLPAERYKRRVR